MRIAFILLVACVGSALAQSPEVVHRDKHAIGGLTPGRVVGMVDKVVVVGISQTRMVAENRVRTMLDVDDFGVKRTRVVNYVVHRAVSDNRHVAFDTSTVPLMKPDGTLLDPDETRERLVKGAVVLICQTPKPPAPWQQLLSEKTIVIIQAMPGVQQLAFPPAVEAPRWEPSAASSTSPGVQSFETQR